MKSLLFFMMISITPLYADQIRVGMNIDSVKLEMTKAKYTGGDRNFIYGGFDSSTYSTYWSVGQGTLLATFDEKTREVTSLTYSLCCDSEEPFRKHFQMNIEWFDSEDGKMLVILKNGEQDDADQPATAPESKPSDGVTPNPESKPRPQ